VNLQPKEKKGEASIDIKAPFFFGVKYFVFFGILCH
jgi:hypothetical protein